MVLTRLNQKSDPYIEVAVEVKHNSKMIECLCVPLGRILRAVPTLLSTVYVAMWLLANYGLY